MDYNASPYDMMCQRRPLSVLRAHEVRLLLGSPVERIEANDRQVTLTAGNATVEADVFDRVRALRE